MDDIERLVVHAVMLVVALLTVGSVLQDALVDPLRDDLHQVVECIGSAPDPYSTCG